MTPAKYNIVFLLVTILATAFFLIRFIAHRDAFTVTDLVATKSEPEHCRWLVVMGRCPEREVESQITRPYRNTQTAVYEEGMSTGVFCRRTEVLMARSTATCTSRPIETDIETMRKYQANRGTFEYGFQSVPDGAYWLTPDMANNPSTWWTISHWGAQNGVISLSVPELIRQCRLIPDATTTWGARIVDIPGVQNRYQKNCTSLHGTVTTYWSHIDSKGCINLCLLPNSKQGVNGKSDWGRFSDWVKDLGLLSKRVGLVILPFEVVCDQTKSTLADQLKIAIRKDNYVEAERFNSK